MRKYYTTLYFFLFVFVLSAQVTNEGKPKSWELTTLKTSATYLMDSFDVEAVKKEDAINDTDRSKPWRFGYDFKVSLGLDNAGTWDELPNGDRIWRINIISQGAKTMNFIFDKYWLPEGAKIYLYNQNRTDLVGAYTHVMNNKDEMLGTWLVEGDNIWIEYYEPKDVAGQGFLNIGKVIHGYRSTTDSDLLKKGLNDSGDCNLDVDCSIGTDFDPLKERLKRSVALIIMNGFVCTGQLINNTNNDQTPYFLTANHCDAGATSTWSFRFNWRSPNPVCATTANSTTSSFNTTSGATNLANNANTDVRLLQLTGGINQAWDLEWAGWNRTNSIPNYTVGIHHPAGDIMKVCRDNDSPFTTFLDFNGDPTTQVWAIPGTGAGGGDGWDMGVTEGGSSGSALFDQNGHIIGQLAGGTAACSGTTDNSGFDVYGRFDISWTDNNFAQWLDPAGTGQATLNNYTQVLSTPDISFEDSISIYPNPVSSLLTISNESQESMSYTLYTILGKAVLSGSLDQTQNTVDVSRLKEGIYMIKINQNAKAIHKKLVISH